MVEKERIVRRLLEDISVQIVDLRLSMTFLNQERTAPGPTATVSVAMLMLQTTDAHGNVVKLSQARSDGRRGTDITVHKEVFLGSAQLAVAGTRADGTALRADVLKVQPSTLHIAATRAAHGLLPHTVAVTGVLPLLIAQADADNYHTLMEVVTGLLWCLREQTVRRTDAAATGPALRTLSPAPDTPELVLAPGDLADDAVCDRALEEAFADECGSDDDDDDSSATEGVPTVKADVLVAKVEVRCAGVARLVVDKCRLALQADALPPGSVDSNSSGVGTKQREVTACCVVEQVQCVDLSVPGVERPVVVCGDAAAPLARVQAVCRRTLRGTRPTARSPPFVELYAHVAPLDVAVTEAFVRRCAEVFYFRPVRPWPAAPARALSETLWFLEDVRAHVAVPHVSLRVCECGGAGRACTLAATVDGLDVNCARLPEALASYYSAAFHRQPAPATTETTAPTAQRDYLYEPEVHELCAPAAERPDSGAAGPFSLLRCSVALAGCVVAVTAPEIAQPAHTVRLVDVREPRVRAELFRPLDYLDAKGGASDAPALAATTPALVVKADVAVRAAADHAALWHGAQAALRAYKWLAALVGDSGGDRHGDGDGDGHKHARVRGAVVGAARRPLACRTAVALRVHDIDAVCTLSSAAVPTLVAELERLCGSPEGSLEERAALRTVARTLLRETLLGAACPTAAQCEVARVTAAAVHVLARGGDVPTLDALCEGLAVRADGGPELGVQAVLRTTDGEGGDNDWAMRGKVAVHGAVLLDSAGRRVAPTCHAEVRGVALELCGPLARCVELAHRVQAAITPYVKTKVKDAAAAAKKESQDKDEENEDRHRRRRQVRAAVEGGKRRLFGVAVTADVADVAVSYAPAETADAAVAVVVAPAVPEDEAALLAARAAAERAQQETRHAQERASVAAQLAEQGVQARTLQAVLVDARLRAGEGRQQCAELDAAVADAARACTRAAEQCALAEQAAARMQGVLAQPPRPQPPAGAVLSEAIVARQAQLAAARTERDALAQEAAEQRAACERELEAFERARDAEEQQLHARIAELERAVDARAAAAVDAPHAARCSAAAAQHAAHIAARANNERSMFAVLPAVVQVWEGPAVPVAVSVPAGPPAVPPPVPPRRHRSPPLHAAPTTPPPRPPKPPVRPPKPAVLSLSLDDSLFTDVPQAQPASSSSPAPVPGNTATAAPAVSADPFASLLG